MVQIVPLFFLIIFFGSGLQVYLSTKVFLHVGPHRTGCTHIQEFALTNKQIIEDAGFCFPFELKKTKGKQSKKKRTEYEKRRNIKSSNDALNRLHANQNDTRFIELISPCVVSEKNVFISSEILSSYSPQLLEIIKSSFPTSYEFHVIITYREWLTRMYSQYTEQTKRSILTAGPISEYIFQNYGQIGRTSFNYTFLIETFSEHFKFENIHLIDYYGIEATGKDITAGIFCDVLNINTICNSNFAFSRINAKTPAHFIHLVSLLRNYAFNKGYEFDDTLMKKRGYGAQVVRDMLARYTTDTALQKLPIKRSNLKLLHPYAIENDQEFRGKFGKKLLYNNVSATLDAIQNIQATEIDMIKFYQDIKYNSFLDAEFQLLVSKKILKPKTY